MYPKSLSGRPYNAVVRISYVTLHKPLTALKLLPNQWNENNGVIITSVSETYIRIAFYNWTEMLTIPKFLLLFLSPFHELNIKQNKPFLFLYVERTAPIPALKKKILSNRQSWWIKIWKNMKTLFCLPGTPSSPHFLSLLFPVLWSPWSQKWHQEKWVQNTPPGNLAKQQAYQDSPSTCYTESK